MSVDSLSNGKLIIEVPRVLVNSPQVVVGGALVPVQETTSNSKVRTLVVDFHKGSSGIEIQDKAPASNNLSSESQISTLSTYESPKYGIRSIQYPSNWTVKENDLSSDYNIGPDYNNALHIVEFSPPNTPAFVVISISDSRSASNLDNHLSYAGGIYKSRSSSYQDINSNVTSKLAGNPAYSLEFKDVPAGSTENIEYTQLELGTIISSGLVFYIDYRAESPTFSTFLPTVWKIINSLKIDESATGKLTIAHDSSSEVTNTRSINNRNSAIPMSPPPSAEEQPSPSEPSSVIPHLEQPRSSTDNRKQTDSNYEDGFQRGAKDAGRDLQGLNGHGFDDSCPKGHTSKFCEGYTDGYNERWNDTPENDT